MVGANGVLARTTFERTYSPWTARGSLQVPLGTSLALGVSGEVGRTAFYEWAGGDVQLTVKLRKVRD